MSLAAARLAQQNNTQQKRIERRERERSTMEEFPLPDSPMIPRWDFWQYDDNSMNIGDGTITRRGIPIHYTSGESGDVTGLSSNGTYYIYAELARTDSLRDPALIPDSITINKSSLNTWPTDTARNVRFVLGEVVVSGGVISEWTQYITDNIYNNVDVPDAESVMGTAPLRYTLEWWESGDEHQREMQLYAVDTCSADSNSMTYFASGPDAGGSLGCAGELHWAAIDSHYSSSPTQYSLEIANALMQLYGFDSQSDTEMDTGDRLLFRQADDGSGNVKLRYVDTANLASWAGDDMAGYFSDNESIDHHGLEGLNDGDDDVDHDWAWCNSQTGYISDYTRNYCYSIGRTSSIKAIDLTYMQLFADNSNYTLDWSARQFDGTDWTFLAGTVLKSADTTAATGPNTGGVQLECGFSAKAQSYVECSGAVYKIWFGDNTTPGAAVATDGTGTARVCDGSYCFHATAKSGSGSFNAPSGDGYYVNGTLCLSGQMSTVMDPSTQDLTGSDTIDQTKLESDISALKSAIDDIIDELQGVNLMA